MALLESEMRQARYAKLRIAAKTLGLDDDVYRDKLEAVTGHRRARECSIEEMDRMLDVFRREGFRATRGARNGPSPKSHVRKVYAIWADVEPYLKAETPEQKKAALVTFVRRQTRSRSVPDGVDAPEFLNAAQANKVIEALKSWRRKLEGDVS